jgi:shikimate 5-dehydrogenase
MGFVGVSTNSSSIMKVFPLWADILGLPTRTLRGHDLPLDATTEDYRSLVSDIKQDPQHRGALVTTHKMNLYQAASTLFSEIDPFGVACHEISSISKRDGELVGRAKDPITVALALEDFLPPTYFRDTGAEVLILGAGGSGTALSWALVHRQNDLPSAITVTARSPQKLEELQQVHAHLGTTPGFISYVPVSSADESDALVAALPPGSLVVNATGLGKDRPGSPLSDDVVFPRNAFVWEFNYRGSLEFLHQATAQAESRSLQVVDGWRYFIHGWSQVIADVFELDLSMGTVEELARAAETVRSS